VPGATGRKRRKRKDYREVTEDTEFAEKRGEPERKAAGLADSPCATAKRRDRRAQSGVTVPQRRKTQDTCKIEPGAPGGWLAGLATVKAAASRRTPKWSRNFTDEVEGV
jgi:hypothetical protein